MNEQRLSSSPSCSSIRSSSGSNEVLFEFPPAVLARLQTRVQSVNCRQTLFDMTEPEHVFFPHRGTVISLIRTTDNGTQIEVGVTGAEGFISVETLLDRRASESTAIVQSDGAVSCVSAQRLRAEFSADPNTRAVLLEYLSLYLEHLTQNVVCNRMHSIEQRLSKWLLVLLDRAAGHAIHASHDLLSHMLGTQRSGVTLAIGNLTAGDIIEHGRESIRIKDVDALTGRACECFTVMQEKLDRYRTRRTELRRPGATR